MTGPGFVVFRVWLMGYPSPVDDVSTGAENPVLIADVVLADTASAVVTACTVVYCEDMTSLDLALAWRTYLVWCRCSRRRCRRSRGPSCRTCPSYRGLEFFRVFFQLEAYSAQSLARENTRPRTCWTCCVFNFPWRASSPSWPIF